MNRSAIRSVVEDSNTTQLWKDWYRSFQPSIDELEALVTWAKKEASKQVS